MQVLETNQVLDAKQVFGTELSFTHFSDTNAMRAVFQALPEFVNTTIRCCEIESVKQRLKPDAPHRSSLLACYRLEFSDNSSKQLYLKAFATTTKSLETTPGYLPDLNALVWHFPNDPRLPQLAQLVDTEKVKEVLPYEVLPVQSVDDITSLEVTVVRYKPEDRCTNRYRVLWNEESVIFFGKTFKDERGKALFNNLEKLWQWSSQAEILFQLVQPLGYDKNLKTLWQAVVPGTPLVHNLEHISEIDFLETVAKGLAQLHSSSLVSEKVRNSGECLDEAGTITKTLEQHLPRLKPPLRTLLEKFKQEASELAPLPQQPIHGAFRFKQLLLDDKRVGVVDFDGFALGDPNEDVADFMVELQIYLPEHLAKEATQHFLKTYRKHVPWTVSEKALNWHSVLKWLEHASWQRYQLEVESEKKSAIAKIKRLVAKATHLLAWFGCSIQNWFIQNVEQELFYGLI